MTPTWIDESRQPSTLATAGGQHACYWTNILGLVLADGVSFLLAHLLFRSGRAVPSLVIFSGPGPQGYSPPIDLFALLALVFIAVRYISGDYNRRQLFWDGVKLTTIALLVASALDLLMFAIGYSLYSPTAVICSWLFLLVCLPMMRQGARFVLSRVSIWQIPTAVVGSNLRIAEINEALKHSLALGFDVRWLVVDGTETPIPPSLKDLTVLQPANPTDVAASLLESGCKETIFLAEDMQLPFFADLSQRLLELGISIAIVPSFNRLPVAGVTVNYFFGRNILLLQARSNVQRLPSRIAKRAFDFVASAILLILLSPVLFVLAIAIKVDTRGPITYSQKRVGRHGTQFGCMKFRTMAPNADELLARWQQENPDIYKEFLVSFKLRDDPRVTPVGKWLRRTSLDELPQLWNVLCGEMSLVGPRPIPEQQLRDQYGNAAQLYVQVRPGMSGLWQISGRSETSGDQRIVLDEWYILNWSFWYDIVILIQTARIVVSGKGAF